MFPGAMSPQNYIFHDAHSIVVPPPSFEWQVVCFTSTSCQVFQSESKHEQRQSSAPPFNRLENLPDARDIWSLRLPFKAKARNHKHFKPSKALATRQTQQVEWHS